MLWQVKNMWYDPLLIKDIRLGKILMIEVEV